MPDYISNVDPALNLKSYRDNVLQFVIQGDTDVQTLHQLALWESLGQPDRQDIDIGFFAKLAGKKFRHELGLTSAAEKYAQMIVSFFNKKLK